MGGFAAILLRVWGGVAQLQLVDWVDSAVLTLRGYAVLVALPLVTLAGSVLLGYLAGLV